MYKLLRKVLEATILHTYHIQLMTQQNHPIQTDKPFPITYLDSIESAIKHLNYTCDVLNFLPNLWAMYAHEILD